ncbi:hypothetical protein GCM10011335_10990 [Aureimonas glaciei]|jgi:hypothetical protein|uniref:Uncharacterized protein n=2 Tax=Aureimonas glaciei TaxID=1776957 RepID=A0A916XTX9_9HYPH|nr:hypothetical protein GCM10011335_10990 [Aureimonas glaciei]
MRIPTIDLSGTSLPRLDEMFRYRETDTSQPTTPYALRPDELATIKTAFSGAFRDGRTVQFGPVTARRTSSGNLIVCGLVSIRKPDGRQSGMTLFDGTGSFDAPGGGLSFVPRRLAGGNADSVDVYGDCREAGAL